MLFDLLSETATRAPEACAVILPDRSRLTYAELEHAAVRVASTLDAAGVGAGSRVVLLLPNCSDFVASVFAVARLGGVIVPLTPQFPARELEYYIRDSAPAAVITLADHTELCRAAVAAAAPSCRVITLPLPASGDSATLRTAAPSAGDAALWQYSSGSTGLPKRVVRTHAHLLAEAQHFVRTVGVTASDRILTVVPLFHAHGFGNCLLAAVGSGACMVVCPTFQRARVVQIIETEGVTIFPGVPFMFGILASSSSIPPTLSATLRLAFSAGAPLPREVFTGFRDKFGVSVRQLYGSTETGSVSINLDSCDEQRWSSVGRPMHGVEVRVVDPEGRVLAANQQGEVIVCSAAMATGYAGGEVDSTAAFRDGFYWTSDLGYQDPEGNLYLTGRTTIFIDTGGHKVDPVEVEHVLNRYPKIAQSVVIGVKGRYGRQIVKAVIVAKEACTAEEIASWCRGELADFKIPRLVEFRREIPVSPLGKVLRKYLQDLG